jgi:hypothetical protein
MNAIHHGQQEQSLATASGGWSRGRENPGPVRVGGGWGLCRAKSRTLALSWRFRCSSGHSPVLADQTLDDVGALDLGGHIDRLAGLV